MIKYLLKLVLLLMVATTGTQVKADIHNDLKMVASTIEKQLPIQVDANSKIIDVSANGLALEYTIQVKVKDKSDLKETDFISKVKTKLKKQLCSQNSISYFIENSVKVKYNYADQNEKLAVTITINPKTDCLS